MSNEQAIVQMQYFQNICPYFTGFFSSILCLEVIVQQLYIVQVLFLTKPSQQMFNNWVYCTGCVYTCMYLSTSVSYSSIEQAVSLPVP